MMSMLRRLPIFAVLLALLATPIVAQEIRLTPGATFTVQATIRVIVAEDGKTLKLDPAQVINIGDLLPVPRPTPDKPPAPDNPRPDQKPDAPPVNAFAELETSVDGWADELNRPDERKVIADCYDEASKQLASGKPWKETFDEFGAALTDQIGILGAGKWVTFRNNVGQALAILEQAKKLSRSDSKSVAPAITAVARGLRK